MAYAVDEHFLLPLLTGSQWSFCASHHKQKTANSCLSKIKENLPLFHASSIEHSSASRAAMWLEAKSFQRDPSIGAVRIVIQTWGL
jgi:hypothetical protein